MIFNELIASSGGSGGKVATSTTSSNSSISFTVDGDPTKFELIYVGTESSYVSPPSSSYRGIAGAYGNKFSEGWSRQDIAVRYSSSSGLRIYTGDYLNTAYNNGTFTLTTNSSTYIFYTTGEYYLIYDIT